MSNNSIWSSCPHCGEDNPDQFKVTTFREGKSGGPERAPNLEEFQRFDCESCHRFGVEQLNRPFEVVPISAN